MSHEFKKINKMVRGIRDMYLRYRYKKYVDQPGYIPKPYFSKKECTDHKLSLDEREFKAIVKLYCLELRDYLAEGARFETPHGIGYIQLRRNKTRKPKVFDIQDKDNLEYYKNTHTDGYSFRLKWNKYSYNKTKTTIIGLSWGWKIVPVDTFDKHIAHILLKDGSHIYNYPHL